MKTKFLMGLTLLCGSVLMSCSGGYKPDITKTSSLKGTDLFQADSTSIAQNYTHPKWFTDGKLGIFIHWGIYSVPAYGSEWYSRFMYTKGDKMHKYHTETYGPVDEFGYKDFIPMFTADKFDAAEWIDILEQSGATYIVPVAEHHDGFAMYNSTFNPWNSVAMGPKRDIIGELAAEIKKTDMHFGLSSHRAENAWFFNGGMEIPSDVQDMSISMYGERIATPGGQGMTAYAGKNPGSNEKSRSEWLTHTYELVDLYKPELIWFDWTVGKYPFQETFYKFMAYYYNSAKDWGKDVVVNTKVGFGDNIQIFDIERGKSDKIRFNPWQTDTSIGKKSWSFTPDEVNKSPNHIIDDFIDIVSKNGNLLLNIGPRADGTITEEQQTVLFELGDWLDVNGEAIYGTTPWVRWGEGDNRGTAGYMTDGNATKYSASDIRFTSKDGDLYAIALASTTGDITVTSLASDKGDNLKVQSVSLLGSDQKIEWKQTSKGLVISFPEKLPTDYAHAFKIKYSGVAYGDAQLDVQGNKMLVEQYLHNNSDHTVEAKVQCSVNGAQEQLQSVSIEPNSTKHIQFNYDVDSSSKIATSLVVNGVKLDDKLFIPLAKIGVHNVE